MKQLEQTPTNNKANIFLVNIIITVNQQPQLPKKIKPLLVYYKCYFLNSFFKQYLNKVDAIHSFSLSEISCVSSEMSLLAFSLK